MFLPRCTSKYSVSCTLFLLAFYPWLRQQDRQDCSSPSSVVCVSSIVKTAQRGVQHRHHSARKATPPPKTSDTRGTAESDPCHSEPRQYLRYRTTAAASRELPSHHNRASLISPEPLREHIERHPNDPASKSVTTFSSSGGSRRGVKAKKLNTALQQPNLSMWFVKPRGTRPGGKTSD